MLSDLARTLWQFRWLVTALLCALVMFDFLLGSLRFLLVQGGLFLLGVVVGRYRRPPAAAPRSARRG